ncbi:MAG TPA: PQQ-binding-like beta-propeller repeat protein [Candidatus Megaira endosymbiont of Nemacystus decipiens]|nr:PQQ-binding-like beta-propeller repeat protein [Candidatus Megaera endosymbiont of Nemacystus decipiens]
MKKILILFFVLFLASCDHIGSTRVKNLIDLTPKLEVEEGSKIELISIGDGIHFNGKNDISSFKINKSQIISSPAIAKSVVYTIDKNGYLSAFSLKNKGILWSILIDNSLPDFKYNKAALLYSNGKLYVTIGSRELIVFDSDQGTEIFRKTFPDIVNTKPLIVSENLLILQTISNQLVAFDMDQSSFIWINQGGIETFTSRNHISPININGSIFASYSSGEVILVDAATGENKWIKSLEDKNYSLKLEGLEPAVVISKPVIYNKDMYFATSNGQVFKINLLNGKTVWKKNITDIQSISLSGDNLIITTNARQAAILSSDTGKVKWVADLITQAEKSKRSPKAVVFQDAFVINDHNNVQSLNIIASNGELYQFTVSDEGVLSVVPNVINIPKNATNYWISCCSNKVYFFNKEQVSF